VRWRLSENRAKHCLSSVEHEPTRRALIRQVFVSQQLLLFLREAELVLYILW
jgi:hypothetical protein